MSPRLLPHMFFFVLFGGWEPCPPGCLIHVVMCAVYDVNKQMAPRLPPRVRGGGRSNLEAALQGEFDNANGTSPNCPITLPILLYVLREELSQLFDPDNNTDNDVIDADRFDLNVPPPEEGWVNAPPLNARPPTADIKAGNVSNS
ncbi:hypothetical protein Salat_1404200 [Sesamum alatum]|uniref:Uncharacterized protein n=1 Tax=Sesamum alatum TaxID=300844 RepID=A0AAE1Y9T5_9LAMI|nr:hypothetical protein Salat_1404200 [Sesamum alatum]